MVLKLGTRYLSDYRREIFHKYDLRYILGFSCVNWETIELELEAATVKERIYRGKNEREEMMGQMAKKERNRWRRQNIGGEEKTD